MRFSTVISFLAASALFASSNALAINDDIAIALSQLQTVKSDIHARADPTTIQNDIQALAIDSTTLVKHVQKLVKDLRSRPASAKQTKLMEDATKVVQDTTTLTSDITALAKDV